MTSWIDKISNISEFSLNETLFDNISDMPETIITNTQDKLGGWWLNLTSMSIFLIMFVIWSKKYSMLQTLNLTSFFGFCFVTFFSLSGYSDSLYPFFLFGVLWTISLIFIFNGKNDGKIN